MDGLVIQIDIQKEGGCLSLGIVLIIHKVISRLPSGRNILFLIAPYSQATKNTSQTAGAITPTAVDLAMVSFGPLVLNVKYISWAGGR